MRMKLISLFLAAVCFVSFFPVITNAAEINQYEQEVLELFAEEFDMDIKIVLISPERLTMIFNYFLAYDLKTSQRDKFISKLSELRNFFSKNAASVITDENGFYKSNKFSQIEKFRFGKLVAEVFSSLGLVLLSDGEKMIVVDKKGRTWVDEAAVIKETGPPAAIGSPLDFVWIVCLILLFSAVIAGVFLICFFAGRHNRYICRK